MTNKVKGTCVPVEYLVLGMLENNVYIISDGKATIVVDPTCKPDEIIKAAGGSVDAIILTHRHSDHVALRRSCATRPAPRSSPRPSTRPSFRARRSCRATTCASRRARWIM